ncbi:hypothetical protein NESM_000882300 [Novymonas esmeraldas]|uniref:Uncharacterized protein n=1 Tax=Novymonas esmeraldas TaxID=1808958 RepID=A0AAW0F0L1_9TRYP
MRGESSTRLPTPRVDLDTQPRARVPDECGGVTDLTTSFFHAPLPAHLRCPLFSLQARDGSIHQLTVLSMAGPEVIQMVTATWAGHHTRYVKRLATHVQVNVWIDIIQWTGGRQALEHAPAGYSRSSNFSNRLRRSHKLERRRVIQ